MLYHILCRRGSTPVRVEVENQIRKRDFRGMCRGNLKNDFNAPGELRWNLENFKSFKKFIMIYFGEGVGGGLILIRL